MGVNLPNLIFNSILLGIGLAMDACAVSMANGVELRVPFLDNDIIDLALDIPGIYKIKDNIVYNDAENIALYRLTTYQLEKMFRKVTSDKN